MINNSWYIGYG